MNANLKLRMVRLLLSNLEEVNFPKKKNIKELTKKVVRFLDVFLFLQKNSKFFKFFAIFSLQNGIYRVQYSQETQDVVVFGTKRGKKPLKIATFYM